MIVLFQQSHKSKELAYFKKSPLNWHRKENKLQAKQTVDLHFMKVN